GWELPGVMTAGAAQILMKSSRLLAKDAVLAGSGPLLYLVAVQLIKAGTPPIAIVETQTMKNAFKASRYLPRAMLASKMLAKGMELLRYIRKSGVSRYTSAKDFQAVQNDDGQLTFSFRTRKRVHQLVTPLVLSHQGVVSSTHISRSLGLAHEWNLSQQAFLPIVDKWGRTKNSRIHIAGDGAGIGGARAAIASGRIAVLDMLFQLGKLSDDQRNQSSTADRALLRQSLAIRPFLDALYYPPKEILAPSGETLVCRCEEIGASTIRQTLNQSGLGPRQIKSSTRSGMGPCQGRMCELPIQGILSSCGKKHLLPKVRTPIKPISLGELASLAERPSTKS
ncbi:MAG: NAD(P)/FAD-dependent oxidoreductase, partial [Paracoccaceae bacterium]|nr:NAD(P)/FAD-dependent oxidoreductase [Paracoccaceae bacterium]